MNQNEPRCNRDGAECYRDDTGMASIWRPKNLERWQKLREQYPGNLMMRHLVNSRPKGKPEIVGMTGLSKSTLHDRIRKGQFPAPIRYGARALYREADVREWLAELSESANNPAEGVNA